jgi:hypothetical protein
MIHSTYIVDLTIAGDTLDEDSISRRLGVEATRFFKKGQEKSPGVTWTQSIWSFEVLPGDGNEWRSLEDGLMCLLQKLMPAKSEIKRVAAEFDVTISCGHFYSSFGAGLTLSHQMLELLAQFGVKIRVSNYWSDDQLSEQGDPCPPFQ